MQVLPGHALAIAEPFIAAREGGKYYLPYQDDRGIWTDGIGNTVGVIPGVRKTDAQIDADFKRNTATAVAVILAHVTVSLNENEAAALISLVFNIGVHAFATSTLLRDINAGDSNAIIKAQIELWDHEGGIVSEGLLNRRKLEAALYATPVSTAPAEASTASVKVTTAPPAPTDTTSSLNELSALASFAGKAFSEIAHPTIPKIGTDET